MLKKLTELIKNNQFVQAFRNLPETDKINFKEMKNNFKINQIFRKLPEEDVDLPLTYGQRSFLKLRRVVD